ncbi:PhzF family phenazine biosynthesis protein [soil metagenome]
MAVPLTIVDSFTDRPFSGNPAGVCLLDAAAPAPWMQAVAAEVNLAETAFVSPRADGDHDLRWFTPTVEVPLCGHATLASAHVLGGAARFHTASGLLTCTAGTDGTIAMDLPANPVTPDSPVEAAAWAPWLGLAEEQVRAVAHGGDDWVLVQVADGVAVRAVVPDLPAIASATAHGALVVADATGDPSEATDSVCRVFAPGSGIDEDPVTGAAHCLIGPWLAGRTGRTAFVGRQASRRGGTVAMEVRGDRVLVSGRAVTVFEGRLLVGPA